MASINDVKLEGMSLDKVTIGILAIQGAVSEHEDALRSLGVKTVQIRYPHEFDQCDGIVLPGGESTTMAIVGEESGLFPRLKTWVQNNKPIWGTCAGMILLSDHAIKTALGGQSLVGGLDVHVCRNYFGSQINSCIINIDFPEDIACDNTTVTTSENKSIHKQYPAVFIRAPAILKTGPSIKVLSTVQARPCANAYEEVENFMSAHSKDTNGVIVKPTTDSTTNISPEYEVVIAVQKDNILATAFHPELTIPPDLRWHQHFVHMVNQHVGNK